jgi:hypothetical protein
MRLKSTDRPYRPNSCHLPYSGRESRLDILISTAPGAESEARNKMLEEIVMGRSNPSNTQVSRRLSRELGSNEIDKRNVHSRKHDDPSISTFNGISID